MSHPEPMSRYAMRRLKAETDEKVRMDKVNQIVKTTYEYAISQAKSYISTSYEQNVTERADANFVLSNMTDTPGALSWMSRHEKTHCQSPGWKDV
jgi:hypothetical protein